jgi:hypothetical protein
MIHEHISYGYDYNDETNILAANPAIGLYGFFSTFTLMFTAIIATYKKHNKLPQIDGRNILKHLNTDPNKDMYQHFFRTDDAVHIQFGDELKIYHPDSQHAIYADEHSKYFRPFYERYFKLHHHIEWKLNQLAEKYKVDSKNSISLIIRGSDKWTDFGGMATVGPGAYIRMAEKLVKENAGSKVLLQTEHDDIINFCQRNFSMTFFEETKTTTNASVPIFLTNIENKLDWAEWYVAALWLHARSKYVITYSGNSAFFVYLVRGSTQGLYQEIAFKKPIEDFFVKNVQRDYGVVNLKMSVGEILDRYSICLLKTERLQVDISDEINALRAEVDKLPNDVRHFVGELKEVNGQIWTLEADIRQGKEGILGNEEVGRRALAIREWNNKRVELKNKVNSILANGFLDIKGNHASSTESTLVISLTTVPARLKLNDEEGLKLVIRELCEQNATDYEVHFNIPYKYGVTEEEYIIPEWLNEYKTKYPHLRIFRMDDMGPPTKVLPTLKRVSPETIVLVVDDDLVYHRDMVKEHLRWQKEYPDSAIVYEGRGSYPYYNDIRDSWVLCVTRVTETHGLQHYKSASYKSKLFTDEFWNHYVGKTLSDDVLVGRYFRDTGVPMYSVPYEPEMHLYDTKEKWDTQGRVETFPVTRRAASVDDTGCNDKTLLSQQPKFYEPPNLGDPNKPKRYRGPNVMYNENVNLEEFDTDKISHGYIPIYKEYFDQITDCKKVLEIGVGQGGSLKMLSAMFPDAKVHGIDLGAMPHLHTDKITVHIGNQERRDDLERIVQETNGKPFDVILDDGGHTMFQQQTSLGCLFKHVKSGGYYILEDLHTSRLERFNDENCIKTSLDILLEFNNTGKIVSNYMTTEEIAYLEKHIESVYVWSNTEDMASSVTAIIEKK